MNRLVALVLALFLTGTLHAETRVITLKHRTAEQIAALANPLAPAGAGILAANGQLILHGDREAIEQMAALIMQLDVKARQLRITVRDARDASRSAAEIGFERKASVPRIGVHGAQSRDRPMHERTIMALEGQWAHIETGRSVPLSQQTTTLGPHGTVVQKTTEYTHVGSGFEVMPRIAGNSVALDIRAYSGTPPSAEGGAMERSETVTHVQIPLGEWADLSAISGTQDHDSRGTFFSSRSEENEQRLLQVKVELVP